MTAAQKRELAQGFLILAQASADEGDREMLLSELWDVHEEWDAWSDAFGVWRDCGAIDEERTTPWVELYIRCYEHLTGESP